MQEYINNLKSNMIIPEHTGPIKRGPEHPDPEEAEENVLKYNFMEIIKTFKEEMKNSLKEIGGKTNKNGINQ